MSITMTTKPPRFGTISLGYIECGHVAVDTNTYDQPIGDREAGTRITFGLFTGPQVQIDIAGDSMEDQLTETIAVGQRIVSQAQLLIKDLYATRSDVEQVNDALDRDASVLEVAS